jgi:preprotein translocase subunit SecG
MSLDAVMRQPAFFMSSLMVLIVIAIIVVVIVVILVVVLAGEGAGIKVTTQERVLEAVGDRKEEFLRRLEAEGARRGLHLRPALETEGDFLYEDFFNRATLYAHPEGKNLRYGFTLRITTGALVLGILLLIFFFVGGIILLLVWYLKYGSLKDSLTAAGEAAAVLVRE